MKLSSFLVSLFVMLSSCSTIQIATDNSIKSGVWGGDQMNLVINAQQTYIELPCASIVLDKPITLNKDNTFEQSGVYTQTPGIIPEGATLDNYKQNVIVKGKIEGDVIFLQYSLQKTLYESSVISLNFNKQVTIAKCQ